MAARAIPVPGERENARRARGESHEERSQGPAEVGRARRAAGLWRDRARPAGPELARPGATGARGLRPELRLVPWHRARQRPVRPRAEGAGLPGQVGRHAAYRIARVHAPLDASGESRRACGRHVCRASGLHPARERRRRGGRPECAFPGGWSARRPTPGVRCARRARPCGCPTSRCRACRHRGRWSCAN